jgi:hypothetical protein
VGGIATSGGTDQGNRDLNGSVFAVEWVGDKAGALIEAEGRIWRRKK